MDIPMIGPGGIEKQVFEAIQGKGSSSKAELFKPLPGGTAPQPSKIPSSAKMPVLKLLLKSLGFNEREMTDSGHLNGPFFSIAESIWKEQSQDSNH